MNHPCFRALETFTDQGNVYLKGWVYTASSPSLIRLGERLLEAGKVEWVDPQLKSGAAGRGAVGGN